MPPPNRMTFGDLDLAVIDPHARDTDYIYDEVFTQRVYAHPEFRVPARPTILDVGANIGLYSIWASREYGPAAIHAFEASPATFGYLADNTGRLIDKDRTLVRCVNRAVSNASGVEVILRQAPFISGISTMLDETMVPWVRDLKASGELVTHKTITTTLTDEIRNNAIETVDILKIDVEGHFMEVLGGISEADFARIGNIVLEADYLEALGLTEAAICTYLADRGYATEARHLTIYAWR